MLVFGILNLDEKEVCHEEEVLFSGADCCGFEAGGVGDACDLLPEISTAMM